jgi:hypothetical protein
MIFCQVKKAGWGFVATYTIWIQTKPPGLPDADRALLFIAYVRGVLSGRMAALVERKP